MNIVSIANDFSKYPGGRFPEDGEFSGQEFRERFLEPAVIKQERTRICFDGTRGYGSSFLEEAFGGLMRKMNLTEKDFFSIFELNSSRPSLIEEVKSYIRMAAKR